MNIKTMSADEVLNEMRQRQALMREAQTEFFLWLFEIEREREDIWKVNGITSFVGWLTTHQTCEPMQYTEFKVGLGKLNGDAVTAKEFGADLVRSLQGYSEEHVAPEDLKMLRGLTNSFEEIHERKPGEQTAKDWVKRIKPKMPRVIGQVSKLRKLEAQIETLRAELKAAHRDRDQWKKRAEKAERALRDKRPPDQQQAAE